MPNDGIERRRRLERLVRQQVQRLALLASKKECNAAIEKLSEAIRVRPLLLTKQLLSYPAHLLRELFIL